MIPKKIIVHHSLTKDSKTVSWGAIRRFHTQFHGWRDIGYHAGVEIVRSGSEASIEVLMGRSWNIIGAHTKGENYNSLGLCFVGNYDEHKPTDDKLEKGAEIIRMWMDLYDIAIDHIYPHRHFANYKTCPGKLFDMEKLKEVIRE